jgi:hypothetical protein
VSLQPNVPSTGLLNGFRYNSISKATPTVVERLQLARNLNKHRTKLYEFSGKDGSSYKI